MLENCFKIYKEKRHLKKNLKKSKRKKCLHFGHKLFNNY